MRTHWNPPTSIESIFVQIEYGVALAVEGQDEPTKPTILRWAYEIISHTGHFEIACHEWRRIEATTKTWDLFKSHFKAAYRDMRSDATSGTTGYHGTPYAAENSVVNREAYLLARLADSELALQGNVSDIHRTYHKNFSKHVSHHFRTPFRLLLDTRFWQKHQPHQHIMPLSRQRALGRHHHQQHYERHHLQFPSQSTYRILPWILIQRASQTCVY
jgi:hypothetical protein